MSTNERTIVTRGVCGLVVLAALTGARATAADWPAWRGPQGNGISSETNWSAAALQGGAKALWRKNVGAGYSGVAVRGQKLYTMGNKENVDTVWCLDAASGAEVWSRTYPCKAGSYPGPRATPVLDGACLYTFGRAGDALCLDAATGEIKWRKNLETEFQSEAPKWGYAGSPCVDGDLVVYNAGAAGVALRKRDGAKAWASGGLGGYATPVIFQSGSRRAAGLFGARTFAAVDLESGAELWSYPWTTKYDINAADPVFAGSRVLVSSGYGNGSALLDFASGKPAKVWQNGNLASQFSSSVLIDGFVYGITGNTGQGALQCVEFKTGELTWKQDLGFGALIAAGSRLVVLNESGTLFVVQADPSAYRELAAAQGVLNRTCWTAPVLSGGRLYCRNDKGDLVCVDLGK